MAHVASQSSFSSAAAVQQDVMDANGADADADAGSSLGCSDDDAGDLNLERGLLIFVFAIIISITQYITTWQFVLLVLSSI